MGHSARPWGPSPTAPDSAAKMNSKLRCSRQIVPKSKLLGPFVDLVIFESLRAAKAAKLFEAKVSKAEIPNTHIC